MNFWFTQKKKPNSKFNFSFHRLPRNFHDIRYSKQFWNVMKIYFEQWQGIAHFCNKLPNMCKIKYMFLFKDDSSKSNINFCDFRQILRHLNLFLNSDLSKITCPIVTFSNASTRASKVCVLRFLYSFFKFNIYLVLYVFRMQKLHIYICIYTTSLNFLNKNVFFLWSIISVYDKGTFLSKYEQNRLQWMCNYNSSYVFLWKKLENSTHCRNNSMDFNK